MNIPIVKNNELLKKIHAVEKYEKSYNVAFLFHYTVNKNILSLFYKGTYVFFKMIFFFG